MDEANLGSRSLAKHATNDVRILLAEVRVGRLRYTFTLLTAFWSAIHMRVITSIYYAHPTAWNEIGFGGPAYPRGYASLNHGLPEPWEVREVRLDATSD